jgi:MFS transporter, OFA family, oxalate/formate antiporter
VWNGASCPERPLRAEPAVRRMTRQERHGWLIVASLFVTMLAIVGSGYATVPVFVPVLLKEFGWSRATVSLLPSVAALTWGILVFPVGWLLDRVEARLVMLMGAAAAGIGFILASRADSFAPMFLAYSMLGVAIAAATITPAAFVIANWFGARRGLAMGVTLGGTTTGGMLMTLTAGYVIAHWGWRVAYLVFAAPVFVIVIPSVALTVRSRPPGERTMSVAEAGDALEGFETAEAIRTRSLWMIVLAQFLWAFATTGSIIHLVQYLIDHHYSAASAANLLSLIFGLCTLGKVAMGLVADRVTARLAATWTLLLNAFGLFLLFGVEHAWVIVPLLATYGLLQAAPVMLFPLLTAESMGLKRYGSIFGIVSCANTIGAVFGPPVAGSIFDATHSYVVAFSLFVASYFAAAIASYLSRPYEAEVSRITPAASRASA